MITLLILVIITAICLFALNGTYDTGFVYLMAGLLIAGAFLFLFMKYGPTSLWNNDNQVFSYMIAVSSLFSMVIGGAGLLTIFIRRSLFSKRNDGKVCFF
jgi:hypothetical protein